MSNNIFSIAKQIRAKHPRMTVPASVKAAGKQMKAGKKLAGVKKKTTAVKKAVKRAVGKVTRTGINKEIAINKIDRVRLGNVDSAIKSVKSVIATADKKYEAMKKAGATKTQLNSLARSINRQEDMLKELQAFKSNWA